MRNLSLEVTTNGLNDENEFERLGIAHAEKLEAVKNRSLPFCPAINTICNKNCTCYIAPKASQVFGKSMNKGMTYFYSHSCDNCSIVYQGPE